MATNNINSFIYFLFTDDIFVIVDILPNIPTNVVAVKSGEKVLVTWS
jgi:hypothetical protein